MVVKIQSAGSSNVDPRKPVTEADGHTGAVEISLSGMVEDAMWPAKKVEWTRNRSKAQEKGEPTVAAGVAMEIFESVAGWMDTETSGSTDMFGMHNVVWRAVI